MRLITKFTPRRNNVDKYHYDLIICEKTKHIMLFRNELLLYDKQLSDEDFKISKDNEEMTLIQLCIKHPDIITYSKTVFFDR